MTYSISSISNRDLQLLYHYRILRQPSDFLKAVYSAGPSSVLEFNPGEEQTSDDGSKIYTFITQTDVPEDKIPLLEFSGEEKDWQYAQYLINLEVDGDTLTLTSTVDTIGDMVIKVYWVSSLEEYTKILQGYQTELLALQDTLSQLDQKVDALSDTSDLLLRPTSGIPDNLVMLVKDGEQLDLGDSGYRVVGAVRSQSFNNKSNDFFAGLVREITEDISIYESADRSYTLNDFFGAGTITITGVGSWYIRNVTNPLDFQDFSGTIYLENCPAVRINRYAKVKELVAVNSFVVHNARAATDAVTLIRHSVLKHNSGVIKELKHVGVACEYYSQVPTGFIPVYEPSFDWRNVQGTVCLGNGLLIVNGRDLSFVTGHHDDPFMPSSLKIVTSGDAGKEEADKDQDKDPEPSGDRDPITGNTPMIKVYNWLLVNTTLTKPAICGAMGNIQQESQFDPFIHGAYYGLWQTNRPELRDMFEGAGLSQYWHTLPVWSTWTGNVTEAEWDEAIDLNLRLLVSTRYNAQGFSNYQFDECLGKPTVQEGADGAAAYAELFAAMVERCVYGTDAIQDTGVANFIKNDVYMGSSYLYQDLVQRRQYARSIYNQLVGD